MSRGDRLTLALPKGRLTDRVREHCLARGIDFTLQDRKLVARDENGLLEIFLVKNSDLPTYVHHGIAGLGICGDDVLSESEARFFRLMRFPFGTTTMCLAGKKDRRDEELRHLTVATKFPRFTRTFFHGRGIPVEIIKLNGSVELAPVLGLAPYIVDLVETGNTLRAHHLEVLEELADIGVWCIANPAYYKLNYRRVDRFIEMMRGGEENDEKS